MRPLNRVVAAVLQYNWTKRLNRTLTTLMLLTWLTLPVGCFKESKVDPAKPATFVRSYNNGYDTFAVQIEETSDGGYIILANTNVRDSEAEDFEFKIVLIKTDQYGNEIKMQHFPDINDKTRDFIGTSITLLDDGGYLITGREIEERNQTTKEITRFSPLIMMVDNNLENVPTDDIHTYPGANNARVLAATTKETNTGYDFLVLTSSTQQDTSFMILSEISSTTFQINWTQRYYVASGSGAAELTPVNKLFFDAGNPGFAYFGGTATKSNRTNALLTKAQPNRQLSEFANEFGYTGVDETVNDICRFGTGYAMIGKTNINNNDDILFVKVSNSGFLLDSTSFVTEILSNSDYSNTDKREEFKDLNSKNEVGNSISATRDGGFIILSTIDTYGAPTPLGAGNTDLSLLKVNGLGERTWAYTFGGSDAEIGNCVRQTTDGGYAALGTSRLGNRRTILFLKTDTKGEID